MDKYDADRYTTGGIIDPTKTKTGLKEYQTVIAVGGSVREIEVGNLVCINPARFAVKKHKENSLQDGVISDNVVTSYNFDVVTMNDIQYLLLQDRDIEFIVEDSEEVPDPEPVVKINGKQPSRGLILPPKGIII